jgi:hypothetical protein
LNEEVDGVAGQIAVWSAPVAFFDDQSGKGRYFEITRFRFDQLQSAFLEQPSASKVIWGGKNSG